MGLTSFNRQRREMEAQAGGGQVIKAQAHYDAAVARCENLEAQYRLAEAHQAAMAAALEAITGPGPAPKKQAKAKKAAKKKVKKPAAKKGK